MPQFLRDIEQMINERPNWYWRACWLVITPLISVALIVFLLVAGQELTVGTYHYPRWALGMGYLLAFAPAAIIFIWFLYKYCKEGGLIVSFTLAPVYDLRLGTMRGVFSFVIQENVALC